jgi:hypothetical protein
MVGYKGIKIYIDCKAQKRLWVWVWEAKKKLAALERWGERSIKV